MSSDSLKITISQPMYFPWVGFFEQFLLSDIFVYYNDVQFTRGFFNRIQLKKSSTTSIWMSIPLKEVRKRKLINEMEIDNSLPWQSKHRNLLKSHLRKGKYLNDALCLLDNLFQNEFTYLDEITIKSIELVVDYYKLKVPLKILKSSQLSSVGSGTERLVSICKYFNANCYITGHGAYNYLDQNSFHKCDINVYYMKYNLPEYDQCFPNFTPFVSVLDLVANMGKSGRPFLCPNKIPSHYES